MSPIGEQILACLTEVAAQRARRGADASLASAVRAVKGYQHARFQHTYADMLAHQRYGAAAQFFLDDLYGPGDFTSRDEQFARIVPGLVRMFPREIVTTVLSLGQLHALSERLDTEMGVALLAASPEAAGPVDGARYGLLWRSVGQAHERERQIVLMLRVGQALDGYTRNTLLRHSLRLMRGPAQAAGLGALQNFLERGFDTFRAMRGSEEFLAVIATRERALASLLFSGADGPALRLSP
ncbi:MAG TPA: hypothetical protein PLL92_09315 [Alicycliphilus sp.]|nr:hypothetical protein [Alicycliphilus sp.]